MKDFHAGVLGIRIAEPSDMNFVCASWFESYWKLHMRATGLAYESYKAGQDKLIQDLIERSTVEVVFAQEVPDEIVGYVVAEPHAVHYVYVKAPYRKRGVARFLLFEGPRTFSHDTPPGRKVAAKLGYVVNPYAVFPRSNTHEAETEAGRFRVEHQYLRPTGLESRR